MNLLIEAVVCVCAYMCACACVCACVPLQLRGPKRDTFLREQNQKSGPLRSEALLTDTQQSCGLQPKLCPEKVLIFSPFLLCCKSSLPSLQPPSSFCDPVLRDLGQTLLTHSLVDATLPMSTQHVVKQIGEVCAVSQLHRDE